MKNKRYGKVVGIVIIVLVVLTILWVKFFPAGTIKILQDNDNPISTLLCSYPVTVSGESMMPFLQPDTKIIFDKCFSEEDLVSGMVVVFNDGAMQRIGIIRYTQDLGKVVYKVSNESRNQELKDVAFSEIVGIYNMDTSHTSYVPNTENIPSTLLSDYFSEAYLGTIPRNMGLENSELRKASTFNLSTEKFCVVVNPVKNLYGVETEIVSTETNNVVKSSGEIIFPIGENINCDDDPLDLDSGSYIHKIYVNNVLISELAFQII